MQDFVLLKPKVFSSEYFAVCGLGGLVCCATTHFMTTPIDIVKCNIQANPTYFPNSAQGFKSILNGSATVLGHKKGIPGLFKGWSPTMIGYGLQGACKFGFYEFFKYKSAQLLGEDTAIRYRDLVYLTSAACAEFIGDIFLCPFEAVKVKMQLDPKFCRGLIDGFPKFVAVEGYRALFAGIVPLWGRQIPYTVIKFAVFERISEFLYNLIDIPKSELSKLSQTGIVFTAGYTGGMLCAIGSQPADSILSVLIKQNKEMKGSNFQKIAAVTKQLGFKGLFAGLIPRTFMIGSIAAAQWLIYAYFKQLFGLEMPGSSVTKK